MIDGGLAVAVLVILAFAGFIFWAKSETGRKTLRSSLGEPATFHKTRRALKKRPPASKSSSSRSKTPTKRSRP
jgi:hypothetical protein